MISVPGREDQLSSVRSLHLRDVRRTDHHLELVIGDHAVLVTIRVAKHLQVVAVVCGPAQLINYLIDLLIRHRHWQSLHYLDEFLLKNNREIETNI